MRSAMLILPALSLTSHSHCYPSHYFFAICREVLSSTFFVCRTQVMVFCGRPSPGCYRCRCKKKKVSGHIGRVVMAYGFAKRSFSVIRLSLPVADVCEPMLYVLDIAIKLAWSFEMKAKPWSAKRRWTVTKILALWRRAKLQPPYQPVQWIVWPV